MDRQSVELRVGGQTYRVVASADEEELQRLADVVDHKLHELTGPGRAIAPQALLLAAISLAHELEEEQKKRAATEANWKQKLQSVLARIDAALEPEEGETPTPPSEGPSTTDERPQDLHRT